MIERISDTLKYIVLICISCICMTACGSKESTDVGYTDVENEAAVDIENTEVTVKEAAVTKEEYSQNEEEYGQNEETEPENAAIAESKEEIDINTESVDISREIDEYIQHFIGLYTSNYLDDTAPAMVVWEQEFPGDNESEASLTVYSDLSGNHLRYELHYYGETGNQIINYYLCENFVWVSSRYNCYSSWMLSAGDSNILYSEIDNWIIMGETVYIMHDNGELEETDKTQLEIPMPEEIAESTSYSYTKIGDVEYEITLYDKVHNEVYSEVYPEVSWVKKITDNVCEIGESFGSPVRYTFYFDTETAEISDTYYNAKLFGDRYIAYMEKDVKDVNGADIYTLILTDIFKNGILHQEIVRDFSFSVIADPMSVITSVEMIDDKTIRLEYFEGEDMTDVSEIIELKLNETVDTR